ncbi:transcriptional regulator with XRE-family HTH domain [Sphingobium sp. B1D7B]|uniref:helix-turn-helix domain-containing protein n=1 Tax=Sphingobium sp. B1D7B TaxID=2940578 RepID=UPI00222452FE|nr:helix-turn-helix transcriptional regulator [Sphingobium sp. B1D7B]MCW2405066.1 transcriptional regulator with XRE-family HTH domain [Sphingobium sp. B1D7B]
MPHNVHHMHVSVKRECACQSILSRRSAVQYTHMGERFSKTYLREWRKARGFKLEEAGEKLKVSGQQLGKIEKGQSPYMQKHLEVLAREYRCTIADLLFRDPDDPEGFWSIWDRATPDQRAQITDAAYGIVERRKIA